MRFDRDKFFAGYRAAFGDIRQQQVDGLNFLLDRIEQDFHIQRYEWAGYMLSTVRTETAYTFQPIHEYGGHAYFVRKYGSQTKTGRRLGNRTPEEGATFSGEGDVQLTGYTNYARATLALRSQYPNIVAAFEARTGVTFDLVKNPSEAGDPAIAYAIMSYGMRTGMFTGKKLSDYNLSTPAGRLAARRIINGQDKAQTFANDAAAFTKILKDSLLPDAIPPVAEAADPLPPVNSDPTSNTPPTDPPDPADTPAEQAPPTGDETQPLPNAPPSVWDRLTGYQQKAEQVEGISSSVSNISGGSSLMTWTTKMGGWSTFSLGLFRGDWIVLLAGLILIALSIWYYSKSKDRANARLITAPPTPVTADVKV